MEIIGPRPNRGPQTFQYLTISENIESTFLARGSAADVWKITEGVNSDEHRNFVYVSKIIRVTPEDFASYAHTKATGSNKSSENKVSWGHLVQQCKAKALIWVQLTHHNIVKVYGLQPSLNICVEYCSKGTLREYLQEANVGRPDKEKIICDILEGMEYMHNRDPPVIHGNLNAGKIFIDAGGRTKIGEFGLAALCYHVAPLLSTVIFTGFNRWMSPELFRFDSESPPAPTVASDIWALACTIFEVVSEKLPYPDYKHDIRVQRAILKGERPGQFSGGFEENHDSGFWALVESCWSKDPLQRPSIKTILISYIDRMSIKSFSPSQPTGFPDVNLAEAGGAKSKMTADDVTEEMEQTGIRGEDDAMRDRADAVEEFKKSLVAEREAERAHLEAIAARKREQKKLQALIGEASVDEERKNAERIMDNLGDREKEVYDEGQKSMQADRPIPEASTAPDSEVTSAVPEQSLILSPQRPTSGVELPLGHARATSKLQKNTQSHDSQMMAIDSSNSKTPLASPIDDIDPEIPPTGDPIMSPTTLRGHLEQMTAPSTRTLISSLLGSTRHTGDLTNPQVNSAYSLFSSTPVASYGRFTGFRTSPYPLSHQPEHFYILGPPNTLRPNHDDESYVTRAWSTHNLLATAPPSPRPSASESGLPPPPRQNMPIQAARPPNRSPKVTTTPLMRGLRSKTSWERYQENQLGFGLNNEGTDDEYEDGDEERGKSKWAWVAEQRIHKHTPSFLDLRSRRQSQL